LNRSDSTKGLGIVQAKDNRKGWYFRPNYLTTLLCVIISALGNSQSLSELKSNLQELENSKGRLESTVVQMDHKIEKVKLRIIHEQLKEIGFPTNDPIVHHEAMSLAYAEKTEQAKWVMHIISPEIIEGTVHRTNDFRIDTMVNSGSAQELDYFIKTRNADGEFEYDGFGFDRGHLAPSADSDGPELLFPSHIFIRICLPNCLGSIEKNGPNWKTSCAIILSIMIKTISLL